MDQEINPPIIGAAPAGTQDRESAAQAVREMFTSIAPRYDLLNHLLSFNIDKLWWRRTARNFAHLWDRPDARVLDLCCGTGDMTFALVRAARQARGRAAFFGVDFSHEMLLRAGAKSAMRRTGEGSVIRWVEAAALRLPFPDGCFHLVTSAFGFRNLVNYEA